MLFGIITNLLYKIITHYKRRYHKQQNDVDNILEPVVPNYAHYRVTMFRIIGWIADKWVLSVQGPIPETILHKLP